MRRPAGSRRDPNASRAARRGWRGVAALALLPGILGAILLVKGLPDEESTGLESTARLNADGSPAQPGDPATTDASGNPITPSPTDGSGAPGTTPTSADAGAGAPAAGPAGTTPGTGATTTTAPAATPPGPARPVKILISGESTALSTGSGIRTWAQKNGRANIVEIIGGPGCALEGSGTAYWRAGFVQKRDSRCPYINETLSFANRDKPDLIIMFIGSNQLSDWLLPGDSAPNFSFLGDGRDFSGRYTRAATGALRALSSLGIPILFTSTPVPNLPVDPTTPTTPGSGPYAMNNAGRTSTLNSLSAGVVRNVPLAAMVPYAERLPKGPDGFVRSNVRPDGLHLDPARVPAIMDAGLEADFKGAYQQVTARVPASVKYGANTWSKP